MTNLDAILKELERIAAEHDEATLEGKLLDMAVAALALRARGPLMVDSGDPSTDAVEYEKEVSS